ATKNHHTSHAVPNPPVIQNAVRQPSASAIGVTSSGASSDPEAAPLYPIATPRERRCGGRQSLAIFIHPGNPPPSKTPSVVRAINKEIGPTTQACDMLESVQPATAIAIPMRSPTKSKTDPHSKFDTV